jgi:hypothetical protein
MKFLKITFAIVLLLYPLIGCEEGNEIIVDPSAKLIWTGDYEVDGCGFFIEIDTVQYKPINEGIIPPEYKRVEPISITVQYIDLLYETEYYCGDLPNPQKTRALKLTSIDLNEELD